MTRYFTNQAFSRRPEVPLQEVRLRGLDGGWIGHEVGHAWSRRHEDRHGGPAGQLGEVVADADIEAFGGACTYGPAACSGTGSDRVRDDGSDGGMDVTGQPASNVMDAMRGREQ